MDVLITAQASAFNGWQLNEEGLSREGQGTNNNKRLISTELKRLTFDLIIKRNISRVVSLAMYGAIF